MAKRLMDGNQQLSVEQEFERLHPSRKGGGRGAESRDLHRVGAGEPSTSTATDTNTSFATPFTTKRIIAEIWDKKLVETQSKFAVFSM